jgi:allophanate hydrolase
VRSIVLGAAKVTAAEVFAGLTRLAGLRAGALRSFEAIDALLLPVTPGHPTLAEVRADPIGVNARLGTYTNMVNLLDLCAVAVPAGQRPDGLPFGVQLLAPAFADHGLLGLAARWCGETDPRPELGRRTLLAVAGAHLSGQPRNVDLLELGGRLHSRARTAPGHRMYVAPGPFPRPGVAQGPGESSIELEVWDLPPGAAEQLRPTIAAPLTLGPVLLDDGSEVLGFVIAPDADTAGWPDITHLGSWRAYLARGGDAVGTPRS